jgi:hypothetical protein
VCPLSSALVPVTIIRPLLKPSIVNGLHVLSQAMVDRITGAMPREIGTIIWTLDEDDLQSINFALLTILGLGQVLADFSNFRDPS